MTLPPVRGALRGVVILLSLTSVSPGASGGVNAWTTNGPLDARVSAVAADPEIPGLIYASVLDSGGRIGTFRSTTDGSRWNPVGLTVPIGALATGPVRTAYAGGDDAGGLNTADFKTTDAGTTWMQIRPSHTSSRVAFIRVDPRNESRVYLGSWDSVAPGSTPRGRVLFRSLDGGLTWHVIQGFLEFGAAWDLAIDTRDGAVLHEVRDSGYYKSSDFGSTWARIQNGLPTADVRALVLDPVTPSTVYAGGTSGLYRSRDSGSSFSRVGSGLPASPIDALVVMAAQTSRLFAGTRGSGVYATTDGGETWSPLNAGLANLEIRGLALDASGASLHAGTLAGVFDYQFASETLVLNVAHPFRVQVFARDQRTGTTGAGISKYLGDLAGYFSLPTLTLSPETPEVFVKIVDGRAINGKYWLFHAGLTDLEYTLTVTEEATGRVKTYSKAAGSACGGIDTSAFGP